MRATVILVLMVACKKEPSAESVSLLRMAEALTNTMCACTDFACANKVHIENAAVRETIKARASELHDTNFENLRRYSADYDACLVKAKLSVDLTPADASIDAAPTDENAPLPPTKPVNVDQAIRDAKEWAKTKRNGVLAEVAIDYVDISGTLDDEDGAIELSFGQGPIDDPKRKTGAPVKRPDGSQACFALRLAKGVWTRTSLRCGATFAPLVTCPVVEVMRKAVALKAPADALAKVALRGTSKLQWDVGIDDELRNVHFRHFFDDDCTLSVEQGATP